MPSVEPGVIVHTTQPARRRSSRARRSSSGVAKGLLAGRRSTLHGPNGTAPGGDGDDGEFDLDRLSYMSTALAALPGMSLRKHFVPVMRLFRRRLAERRATRERFAEGAPLDMSSKSMEKRVQDGLQGLAKALMEASREVGATDGAALSIDAKALAALLQDKTEPVSILADHVLTYPCESPESQFVYILLNGGVNVTYYQAQGNRSSSLAATGGGVGSGGGGDNRTQYYTSSDEKIVLCGGGVNMEGNNLFLAAAQAHEARQNNKNNATANDTASNMTSAIQRSLRNASRAVGQPTLTATRTELIRAPSVLGAAEALGLAPSRCASITAATSSTGKGEMTQYVPYADVLRIRLLDVHAALLKLCGEVRGVSAAGGHGRASVRLSESAQNAVVICTARSKTLSTFYYQNEVLMRQSWLLQDTPTTAIRTLISLLRPRTYMPGEVLACPHQHSKADRQLCFLRRGRMRMVDVPCAPRHARGSPLPVGNDKTGDGELNRAGHGPHAAAHHNGTVCPCAGRLASTTPAAASEEGMAASEGTEERGARTVGVAESGSSFGELALLFGEPRSLALIADTACDVWCLSYHDFSQCMRRDDALRRSLVDKAAALRVKWLGEQRFTATLAEQLRRCCELFRPLSDYVIRLIQERLEPVVYAAGSIVASTSSRCDGLTLIIHGSVVSVIEGVACYGPGDVIGEGCLVAHRWPLGLSARSMVEGWKLKRAALQEALAKADLLHAHSGEATSMTPLWLKRIFAPPLPEVETDVVGRQRMPVVGPAPGGEGYPRYGRLLSEVFLKALCFRYRDYVRWEDICYDTLGGPQGLTSQTLSDQLSRELVQMHMRDALASARGEPRPSTAPLATRLRPSAPPASSLASTRRRRTAAQEETSPSPPPATGRRRGTLQDVHAAAAVAAASAGDTTESNGPQPATARAAGAGMDAARKARQLTHTHPNRVTRGAAKRRQTAGASAFLVSADAITDPFRAREGVLMSVARGSAPTAPTATRRPAATGAVPTAPPLTGVLSPPEGIMSPAATARWERTLRCMQQPPPQLEAFATVLNDRDRLYATERQQDVTAEQQQAQRETQVRERLQVLKANSAAATTSAAVNNRGSASAVLAAESVPPPLPPVHLFLSDPDNPRAELSVAEAIAVGYVLQLPSKDHIQSSVSVVDPDITLGLPSHRARRRAMALTPNERHSRHNFLFAAASFVDASESASRYQERKGAEQERQAKAKRLLDMLQAADDRYARRTRKQKKAASRRGLGEDGVGSADSASDVSGDEGEPLAIAPVLGEPGATAATGGFGEREASPTVALSPQISAGFFVSPERDHGSGGSTPSPFRGSPGKAAQKREEGYQRLLSRDPVKALDMLHHQYNLPWTANGSPSSAGSPLGNLSRGAAPPAPPAGPPPLTATSLTERLLAATQPTTEPKPGLNFDHAELIFASGRDRRACAAYLTVRTGAGADVALLSPTSAGARVFPAAQRTTGLHLATPTATATEAATGEIDAIIHAPEAALFVEGYGTLKPEPAPVRSHALLTLPLDALTVPPLSPSGQRRSSVGAGATSRHAAAGETPGASLFLQEAPRPQDFVMPDAEEAGQFMRRMQRDVFGLNAIAEEQAKERERVRNLEPRLTRRAERVEAVLSHPTAEETQLVDDWRTAYHLQTRDPLSAVCVPNALLPQAGPNYLARTMQRLQQQSGLGEGPTNSRSTAHANVVAWQDQVAAPSVAPHDSPLHGAAGGDAGAARRRSASSGQSARRLVAAIGTKQLGYPSAPLVSPTQALNDDDYQKWVAQREELFATFAGQQKGSLWS